MKRKKRKKSSKNLTKVTFFYIVDIDSEDVLDYSISYEDELINTSSIIQLSTEYIQGTFRVIEVEDIISKIDKDNDRYVRTVYLEKIE